MEQPISPEHRELMNRLAPRLDAVFNGDAKADERRVGFALFVFNFGETEGGRVNYISNAARPEMIAAVKEWLARAEGRHHEGGRA